MRLCTIFAAVCSSSFFFGSIACSKSAPPPEPEATRELAPKVEGAAAGTEAKAGGASKATGQGYVVEVTSAPATAGAEGSARLTLKATGGYHVNKEFPLSLKVTPPEGVTLVKAQQGADDAAKLEELEAAWDIKFTSPAAGAKSFAATFRFAVCTETTCDPKIEKLAWNVEVQ
jgi:hypothetical protein